MNEDIVPLSTCEWLLVCTLTAALVWVAVVTVSRLFG